MCDDSQMRVGPARTVCAKDLFDTIKSAADNNNDVVMKLKPELNSTLPIPVSRNDKIAVDVLEFLEKNHGDLTTSEEIDVLQNAMWWITTMSIL